MPRTGSYRRVLFVSAALAAVVGCVIAVGVIPPVGIEAEAGGTPQEVVGIFWLNAGVSLVSAAVLFLLARFGRSGLGWRSLIGFVGFILLLLGWADADAGAAYLHHGPVMATASRLLIGCSVAELLAGVLAFVAAFMPDRAATAPAHTS